MCELTEASPPNPICCQRSISTVLLRKPLKKVVNSFLSGKYFA